MSDEERLTVRAAGWRREFAARQGRAAIDPVELETLRRAVECGGRRWPATTWSFTPVKSVAVLWGIGSEATRQAIFDAHTAAVADCLDWLETHAAFTRTGDRGQAQIDVAGVTAAMFHHWDSRAGDPDLHTHVAVSNKVQGPDGTWRSLDGRPLFAAAVSMSERYNTRIEDELRDPARRHFTERATVRGGPAAGPGDRRRSRTTAGGVRETTARHRRAIPRPAPRLPSRPWPGTAKTASGGGSTSRPPWRIGRTSRPAGRCRSWSPTGASKPTTSSAPPTSSREVEAAALHRTGTPRRP